jgi:hypothetical protein
MLAVQAHSGGLHPLGRIDEEPEIAPVLDAMQTEQLRVVDHDILIDQP